MSTAASGPGSGGPAARVGHGQKRSVQAAFEDTGSPGFTPRARVTEKYRIVGFISSGTYGRVYKAVSRTTSSTRAAAPATSSQSQASSGGGNGSSAPSSAGGFVGAEVAIKKFKPDKEGEQISYTGISQSAIREMSLCSELRHNNVIGLVEIILEDKCIFMVFDYAEHDLLQIIHHHTQQPRHPIPPATVKSIMFQLLNGCQYLHTSWVLHRDLKPANIMVTSAGEVKIGDLGLARRFDKPLHSLFSGDKVVVTIWYRAPELILGSYHYTPAIDMWAVGCIFAELLSLRPIFKGEEAKMDSKKTVPFQRNQMQKIVDIMGLPSRDKWPLLPTMPEYNQLGTLQSPTTHAHHSSHHHHQQHHHHHQSGRGYSTSSPSAGGGGGSSSSSNLEKWYYNTISNATNPPSSTTSTSASSSSSNAPLTTLGPEGYRLLAGLLEYDPSKRLTAAQALQSALFSTGDRVTTNAFEGLKVEYPHRRVSQDDNDIRTSSLPGTKRSGLPDDSLLRPSKRVKD
ncbi:[Pyruvate dehydrogenase (acetyl-transferring)] kinase [Purpureocillium takamizusanense]|uniref:Serine/threonine-protein kinase SSN3 n=1 Tax=Purpureocillium takamizusanense TaxID=2060973 RepID=A0A9Q8QLC4_9HYPO|nr:[Pyruvate dehydrogenase (acetyl-transferring)] kinase [Purpureocillium takamizusanense]UNI21251.1 [Pyruvate dehydrogenase (acetyl-transferring)] kinase [Purpureocillium takamizusanense]